MINVLVTGASGFVGKNVVDRFLQDKRYKLIAFVDKNDQIGRDYLINKKIECFDEDTLNSFSNNVDFCIHLASYGVAYGARDIDTMIDVNIKLTLKIARYCLEHNCKLFINIGSCFEYGSSVTDRKIIESDKLDPLDIYAASKVSCENFLNVWSRVNNLKVITIRPFSLFGKYEPDSRIFPLILMSGINKQELGLTFGEQIRDYMDVSDLANVIYLLIKNHRKTRYNEAVNVCSGIPISLRSFIEKIVNYCDFDLNLFKFGEKAYRDNESMYFAGDNSRLLEIIGYYDFSITKEKVTSAYLFFKNTKRW